MLSDTLHILGYRLKDDSWDTDGRRTYAHDDDATRTYLTALRGILGPKRWRINQATLRTFRHASGEIIEIESGDCSGHYLLHMKAETVE